MVNLHLICACTALFMVASASPQLWRSQRPLSWTDRPFGASIRRSSGAPNPAILLDEKTSDALGNYHFRYATSDGTKHEEKGRAGDNHAVRGSYSFISPEGEKLEVAYTADERGYRALGAHIPTMPPHALQQIKDAQRAAKGQHSGNRRHQLSNTKRQSGNKRHQSGNTNRPSGNRLHQSGNTKRPSGNTIRPSGSKTNHFGITRHQSSNRLNKSSTRLHRSSNKRPQSSKPKRQSSNRRHQSNNKRPQSSKPKRQSSNKRHQSNNKRYQSGLHQSSSKRNQQRIKTINHFQNIFNRQKTRTNSKKASTWPDTRISFPPSFL